MEHFRYILHCLKTKWHSYFSHRMIGKRNRIQLPSIHLVKKMYIEGDNNIIELLSGQTECFIHIYGNNNKVILGKNTSMGMGGRLDIGTRDSPCNNCYIEIGDGTTLGPDCDLRIMEDDTSISLGQECMFAGDTSIWATDSHSIFNETCILMNGGLSVYISDRVWCGFGVRIGKGVHISSDTVIGWGSIVTRQFEAPGVVIAGNPARVVQEHIFWTRERPNYYKKEQK